MKKAAKILLLSALLLTFTVTKQVNAMQNTQEIWKDILGLEGRYQISNLGRVKSLHRIIDYDNKQRVVIERILKNSPHGDGLCKGEYHQKW